MSYLCAGVCWMGCHACAQVFVGMDGIIVCRCLLEWMSCLCADVSWMGCLAFVAGVCWIECHACMLVFVEWDD